MLNKWPINLVFWETGTRGGYKEVIYHIKGGSVPLNAICNDLWLQWPFLITACCHPLSPWKQHCCQLCAWWLGGGGAFDWGQDASICETLDLQVYLFILQEERSFGDMAPSFLQKAPGWGVIQRGTPEQMVSVPCLFQGRKEDEVRNTPVWMVICQAAEGMRKGQPVCKFH